MRALLMDGDAHAAYAISHMLTTAGWIVDNANSAREGLSLARQTYYDIVITDLILPDLSGAELVRHVRATDLTRPMLVLSVVHETNARTVALEAGANAYIQKPFSQKELLMRLGRLGRQERESTASRPPSGSRSRLGKLNATCLRSCAIEVDLPLAFLDGLGNRSPFPEGDKPENR